MRIAALRLLAYGPFTGRSLEFGAQPGFHLVYGANEAGKSTTLRALSSVLFGYPHEVIDNHRHDAKDILLAAELQGKDGKTLTFQRRRRGKNALADSGGAALEQGAIARALGGASQEMFESVFALDHRRLHEHARVLLSGGGSLGLALAAAGAGLANLKEALDQLRREKAELFLAGGQKPELNKRISRLHELRKEARQRQVSLAEYKKREKEIATVEGELAEARTRDRELETELARLQRIGRILPLRARLTAARADLDLLGGVPLLAADAGERRIKAESERSAAERAIEQADKALDDIALATTGIVVDHVVLQKQAAIEQLSQRRSSVEDAEQSLPRRDAEREQLYERVSDLLAKAEISGPATDLKTLLPSLVKRRQIEALARKGRDIDTRKTAAEENAAKTERTLQGAKARSAAVDEAVDLRDLAAALRAADELGDIEGTIAERQRMLNTKKQLVAEQVSGLGLPDGDVSRLRMLAVPSDDTVTRYRDRFAAAIQDEGKLVAHAGQLDEQLTGIEERIAELSLDVGTATRERLQEVRDQREAVWAVLRGIHVDGKTGLEAQAKALGVDGDLAGALERKTEEADRTADAIIDHGEEAAELSLNLRKRAELRQSLVAAADKAAALRDKRKTLESEWRSAWPAELTPLHPPTEMAGWLKRRDAVLREDQEHRTEANAIAGLETRQQEAIDQLFQALGTSAEGMLSSLRQLRARARSMVDHAAAQGARAAAALKELEIAQDQADEAEGAVGRLKDEVGSWTRTWQSALRDAGMDQALAIEPAVAIVETMAEIDALKPQIDQLTHRIDTMTSDVDAYAAEVAALGLLAAEYPGSPPLEVSRQLDERLRVARAAAGELRGLEGRREDREGAKREAAEQLDRSQRALAALCQAAGCAAPNDLVEVEQRAHRRQQGERARNDLSARIVDQGSGQSLEDLLAECDGVDGDGLPAAIAERRTGRDELATLIEARMKQRAELRAAFDGLFGKDEAAESRQDAANVEAEIATMVQRYSDLALQEIVLRRAIDLYRERNQGPILGRAKVLFSRLTNGAYSGLRADFDESGEAVLIAEHPDRGSLEVNALSDGTVDPLYLALRLAAVQEHNATREPLPFMADDLLLNLDNARSKAALSVLGDMAAEHQVLFFTHHEHMVALADAAVPSKVLTVHRL